MSLIQLRGGRRRLLLRLLGHLQSFIDRQTKASGGCRATPQPGCRNSFEANGAVRVWDQNAGYNLYLDRAMHNAMARGTIEIHKGNANVGLWDINPRRNGGIGSLWFV
jgi:hypothetical protein